ncbi:MAG: hypothetical protein EAY65_03020 [Alphaproteobacteria bacterium]|nr:MAG: hypothetical protein EAY65_03020 [Alphaproteobacteria bacterium]
MKYKIFKSTIMNLLHNLASLEYQQDVWLNQNNPENLIGSFVETVNMLFDDSIISYLLENNEVIISHEITQTLRDLDRLLDLVNEFRPEIEIINDPQMILVRQKAAEALALVLMSDGSESTVEIIDELPRAT